MDLCTHMVKLNAPIALLRRGQKKNLPGGWRTGCTIATPSGLLTLLIVTSLAEQLYLLHCETWPATLSVQNTVSSNTTNPCGWRRN